MICGGNPLLLLSDDSALSSAESRALDTTDLAALVVLTWVAVLKADDAARRPGLVLSSCSRAILHGACDETSSKSELRNNEGNGKTKRNCKARKDSRGWARTAGRSCRSCCWVAVLLALSHMLMHMLAHDSLHYSIHVPIMQQARAASSKSKSRGSSKNKSRGSSARTQHGLVFPRLSVLAISGRCRFQFCNSESPR